MANKKKITTGIIAGVTAVALALGGTFAWQSISQTALNEKEAVINPGGRLHDDFNGTNKDVYVENFADDDIFARVRLDEYFEIVMNKGTGAEKTQVVTTGATKDDTDTYITHKFDAENATDDWWNWTTGGSTVYMPTFNKNKDSLVADINGTFENDYEDYVEYTKGQEVTANATYDNDSNSVEDENVTTVEETHTAAKTGNATLISMEDWLALESDTDSYWVYDTDGWVYWSSPIKAGTATGLLLDGISLAQVMDDSYYYAINVVGQFITADDLGKDDNTGFYDTDSATVPSDNALKLLKAIGVEVGDTAADDGNDDKDIDDDIDDDEDLLKEGSVIYRAYIYNGGYTFGLNKLDCVYLSSDNTVDEAYIAAVMNVEEIDVHSVELVENLSSKDVKLPSTGANIYNSPFMYTVSVKFLNKVQPTSTKEWFMSLGSSLNDDQEISIDFTNLDTSKVTDMQRMFYYSNIKSLDLSTFDTSNVTNMDSMFYMCQNLTELNLSSFNTSNVTDMQRMFWYDFNLTLDCSQWNVNKVTDYEKFNEYASGVTAPNWVN